MDESVELNIQYVSPVESCYTHLYESIHPTKSERNRLYSYLPNGGRMLTTYNLRGMAAQDVSTLGPSQNNIGEL